MRAAPVGPGRRLHHGRALAAREASGLALEAARLARLLVRGLLSLGGLLLDLALLLFVLALAGGGLVTGQVAHGLLGTPGDLVGDAHSGSSWVVLDVFLRDRYPWARRDKQHLGCAS